MDDSRPSWQADPCPPWCTDEHSERDHPDDRVHRSRSAGVPVVARRAWFEGEGIRRSAEAADFEVALARVDGEPETWLYVGAGPGISIEVTAESADRLFRAMAEALDASRSR